jgi:hypothetical protein
MRTLLMIAAFAATAALAACQTPSVAYETTGSNGVAADSQVGTSHTVPPRNPWDYPDFQLDRS